jgi:transcriptional regulator with XRE-family HTH domain
MSTILQIIGEQLQRARRGRHLSQAELAVRLGRDRARVSEFERDLANNRMGRDRLTLFAEICDALDLVPIVVPRARAAEIRGLVELREGGSARRGPARSAFDDLFVDLDEDEERG